MLLSQHDIAPWKRASAVLGLFPVELQRAAQAPVLRLVNSSVTVCREEVTRGAENKS